MEMMTKKETALKERIIEVLRAIYDPEIPVDIYELGLIYEIELNEDNNVFITMTLTAPNCPASDLIMQEVNEKVSAIDIVKDVHVNLTFEPPWSQDLMSDVAKLQLGFM
tara:strand:+ start:165 stop:491 length:327 start_codon:yes stop_codon:yes gene_type:complete